MIYFYTLFEGGYLGLPFGIPHTPRRFTQVLKELYQNRVMAQIGTGKNGIDDITQGVSFVPFIKILNWLETT